MPRPKAASHRHSTADRIAFHAIAMFEVDGFDAVTVDSIAERVGVTPRTIFRYFPRKHQIVLDPVRFSYFVPLDVDGSAGGSAREVIRQGLVDLAARIEEQRDLVTRHTQISSRSLTLTAISRHIGDIALAELRKDLHALLGCDAASPLIYVSAEIVFAAAFAARHCWINDRSVSIEATMVESFEACHVFVERAFG